MSTCRNARTCRLFAALLAAVVAVPALAAQHGAGVSQQLALYADASCLQPIQRDAAGQAQIVECQTLWLQATLRGAGGPGVAFEGGLWSLEANGASVASLGRVPCVAAASAASGGRRGCPSEWVSACVPYTPTAADVAAGAVVFSARYGEGRMRMGANVAPGVAASVPQLAQVEGCGGDCAARCGSICRDAAFWGTGGGYECAASAATCGNLTQAVIDSSPDGMVEVCGQVLRQATPTGGLSSVLEGLCVDAAGVEQREVYRELVAAALNCVASGDPSCTIVPLAGVDWATCNEQCALGATANAALVASCTEQLACWNAGGKFVAGGCYLGECGDPAMTLVGSAGRATRPALCVSNADCAFGSSCRPFRDSCGARTLCASPVDGVRAACSFTIPPSSPASCLEAAANTCTIDACL